MGCSSMETDGAEANIQPRNPGSLSWESVITRKAAASCGWSGGLITQDWMDIVNEPYFAEDPTFTSSVALRALILSSARTCAVLRGSQAAPGSPRSCEAASAAATGV